MYYLPDPFDQFQIDYFFPGSVYNPRFEVSQDGNSYREVDLRSENYFLEDEAYGYWKPVRYSYQKTGLQAQYLKITWQTDMHLAHTIIGP